MNYIFFFAGAFIGSALFGALFAWIIRKVIGGVGLRQSYALGLAVVPVLAAFTNTNNPIAPGYIGTFGLYALASVIAYFILVATAGGKTKTARE